MKRTRISFDEWWRIVIKIWRNKGRTKSIPEKKLRELYDKGESPMDALYELLKQERLAAEDAAIGKDI